MTKLYEIANQYAELSNSDEFTPDMIADTLEAIDGEFEDKAGQLLAIIKNSLAEAEMLKSESRRLSERAAKSINIANNIKSYLAESMHTMEKKKISSGVHTLTLRKGSQSVKINNPDMVPSEFVEYETSVKVNKNLIKEKLKLGQKVEGASLETGKPSIIIK